MRRVGKKKKEKKTLLKSLSGSTWLADVKIVGKRKSDSGKYHTRRQAGFRNGTKIFLSLPFFFFFAGPDNYPPVTEKPAELNKEAACVCE